MACLYNVSVQDTDSQSVATKPANVSWEVVRDTNYLALTPESLNQKWLRWGPPVHAVTHPQGIPICALM